LAKPQNKRNAQKCKQEYFFHRINNCPIKIMQLWF
jgi:hypothetical protein